MGCIRSGGRGVRYIGVVLDFPSLTFFCPSQPDSCLIKPALPWIRILFPFAKIGRLVVWSSGCLNVCFESVCLLTVPLHLGISTCPSWTRMWLNKPRRMEIGRLELGWITLWMDGWMS